MTRKVFLNSKDNQFLEIFFSHPILGRTFCQGNRRGVFGGIFFFLSWFVLWIKYFSFYKVSCFYWINLRKIIYLENDIVWNYPCVTSWHIFFFFLPENRFYTTYIVWCEYTSALRLSYNDWQWRICACVYILVILTPKTDFAPLYMLWHHLYEGVSVNYRT